MNEMINTKKWISENWKYPLLWKCEEFMKILKHFYVLMKILKKCENNVKFSEMLERVTFGSEISFLWKCEKCNKK